MIDIKNKDKCCGCSACLQTCPVECISFLEDSEGFLYPKVDTEICLNCGLCEKICPILNQGQQRNPISIYGAINKDQKIRKESSSGGIFTLLAEYTIKNGGVVFGAVFNKQWEVTHTYAHTMDDITHMRGSKYVQSKIGNSFKKVLGFLKEGKNVLFSGTPCQNAGLLNFLEKPYETLICVDIICHGVPSPKVFRDYYEEDAKKIGGSLNDLTHFNFRDKKEGWLLFSLTRSYKINNHKITEPFIDSLYMKGFLKDIYLRPSCYKCPAKGLKSGSDITIADFWGVQTVLPNLFDDKGTSLVLVNTKKGEKVFNCITDSIQYEETEYKEALKYNPSLFISVIKPKIRTTFFANYNQKHISELIKEITREPLNTKVLKKVLFILQKIGISKSLRKIKRMIIK